MRQRRVNHGTSSIKVKRCCSVTPLACFFIDRRSIRYEGPAIGICPGVPAGLYGADRSIPNFHEAVRPRVPACCRLHVWWLQMEEEPERDLHTGSVTIWLIRKSSESLFLRNVLRVSSESYLTPKTVFIGVFWTQTQSRRTRWGSGRARNRHCWISAVAWAAGKATWRSCAERNTVPPTTSFLSGDFYQERREKAARGHAAI